MVALDPPGIASLYHCFLEIFKNFSTQSFASTSAQSLLQIFVVLKYMFIIPFLSPCTNFQQLSPQTFPCLII